MATYTYSIPRDTLIQASFRLLGQFNDDSPPPQTDINNAAQALNLMIKQWMSKNYNLWCVTDVVFTVIQGQTVYPIGSTSTVPGLNVFRPLRIVEAQLTYVNTNSTFNGPLQVPLIELSRNEYNWLGQKQAQGTTNSYYYDPQIPNGMLYLYLTPDQNPNTVSLTCQRPIADVLNSADNFDFPIEWLNALKYGLAAELVTEYFVPTPVADRIERRAAAYLEEMLNWDQEDASTFFTPDMRLL